MFKAQMRRNAVQIPGHGRVRACLFLRLVAWLFCAIAEQSSDFQSAAAADLARQGEFFERNVRPIFVANCVKCHGPEKQEADLRLDSADGLFKGGKSGAVIAPSRPDSSRLIQLVRGAADEQMPPDDRLRSGDIATLEQWVRDGALWPGYKKKEWNGPQTSIDASFTDEQKKFWAFQPVVDVPPPDVSDVIWPKSPIDRFILTKLEHAGLKPAPPADKRLLLRRVTFDLTGLPPTTEELDEFEADDSPDAFVKVVDRLLASPSYGERWGQHWLDIVRFAESAGHDGNNAYLHAWRYRDYVIRSLNEDKPYNDFIVEQLAGDLLPKTGKPQRDFDHKVATAFLQVGPKPVVMRDKQQMLLDIADEQIHTTGVAFLGLTIGCARCHDHKFDPIPTADYYSLAGIFTSTRVMADDLPDSKWVEETVSDPKGGAATLMAVADLAEPKNMHILPRGNYRNPGAEVPRRFLQIIAGNDQQPPITSGSGRLELARWIASDKHPLTARVIVNRIWQHHFGRGLVATSDNFGRLGELPTHPELLDWLAKKFVEGGWSVKSLHRQLLLSSTYQQACVENAAAQRIDPDDHLLWRMPRRRLSAEEIRDGLLAISGQLDRTLEGTLFTDGYQPGDESRKLYVVDISTKDPFPPFEVPRRSVYLPVLRNARPEPLKLFDTANEHLPTTVRGETTVAPQALFLLNSPFAREQAEALAAKLLESANTTEQLSRGRREQLVDRAFRIVFGRPAAAADISRVTRFLDSYQSSNSQQDIEKSLSSKRTAESIAAYAREVRRTTGLKVYEQFGAAIFNGRDRRVQLDLASDPSGEADASTIEFWSRADGAADATLIGADGPNDRLWRIGTEVAEHEGKPINRLFYEFYPAKAGGRRAVPAATASVSALEWYHVAATYGGGKRRLYLNGRCIDECDAAAVLRPTNVPITIGARGDGTEWFRGQVDHVALYDRALDESQIFRNYRLFAKCHRPADGLSQLFAWRAACQALFCSSEFIYVE